MSAKEQQLRRALLINAAILQMIARGQFLENKVANVKIDPPFRGTVGQALDLADEALEPEASP